MREKLLVLVALLVVALTVGVRLADDYGQSWDEQSNQEFGELYLQAYRDPDLLQRDDVQAYYDGPAYFMVSAFLTGIVGALNPAWTPTDARHFIAFCTFLIGIAAFYAIARRLVSRVPAAVASALLLSQPLFFGHSFINLKDLPFTSFFLLSLYLGLIALDELGPSPSSDEARGPGPTDRSPRRLLRAFRRDWQAASRGGRMVRLAILGILLGAVVDLWSNGVLLRVFLSTIESAYRGEALPQVNNLFRGIASFSQEVPLGSYLEKGRVWYAWTRIPLTVALVGLSIPIIAGLFPRAVRTANFGRVRPLLSFVLAGLLLGVATSMRLAAPTCGLMVSALALHRARRRAIPYLATYWLVALVASFATWPLLWTGPVQVLWNRSVATAQYTGRHVMYFGEDILSGNLPWHYLPVLLTIQFTETIFPLALLGGYRLYSQWPSPEFKRPVWIAICGWFVVPALLIVLFPVGIYNNFRQVFFITPPIFLLAGLGVEHLNQNLRKAGWKTLLAALILLPGAVRIVANHPYEYIHYNVLVGGVRGAGDRFEMDYWCTSYREAVQALNQWADANARVTVWGPLKAASNFGRSDLHFQRYDFDSEGDPDLVLGCELALRDPEFYSAYEPVMEVTHRGVPLAVIKARP